jgi:hypothetical protein
MSVSLGRCGFLANTLKNLIEAAFGDQQAHFSIRSAQGWMSNDQQVSDPVALPHEQISRCYEGYRRPKGF